MDSWCSIIQDKTIHFSHSNKQNIYVLHNVHMGFITVHKQIKPLPFPYL